MANALIWHPTPVGYVSTLANDRHASRAFDYLIANPPYGKGGSPEPDPELRDSESVPLPAGDDPADGDGVPAGVRAFFDREVRPHVPDAWIETAKRYPKDGRLHRL